MRAADVHQGQEVLWFDAGTMRPHNVVDRRTWPNGRVTLRLKAVGSRKAVQWTGEPEAEILTEDAA